MKKKCLVCDEMKFNINSVGGIIMCKACEKTY